MRLPIRFYKSSVLATIISFFGSVWCLVGVCLAVSEDVVAGIILAVVGLACLFWADAINERASFKKWIKKLKNEGVEEQLSTSNEMCMVVYNANPCKRTIEYIRKYNPTVAEQISNEIEKNEEYVTIEKQLC